MGESLTREKLVRMESSAAVIPVKRRECEWSLLTDNISLLEVSILRIGQSGKSSRIERPHRAKCWVTFFSRRKSQMLRGHLTAKRIVYS